MLLDRVPGPNNNWFLGLNRQPHGDKSFSKLLERRVERSRCFSGVDSPSASPQTREPFLGGIVFDHLDCYFL